MRRNEQKMIAREALRPPFLILMTLGMLLSPRDSSLRAQGSGVSTLTIRIVGAKNSKGQVAVALFHGADGFPGDKTKALRTLQARIDPGSMSAQVSVADLPHGAYAVAVFHDENMNGRLDKNMLGVPKEGYGFSNITKRSMGPPKFEDARFELNQLEQTIEIRVLY
jgi:uncharacterized protein (DUF2141 family)